MRQIPATMALAGLMVVVFGCGANVDPPPAGTAADIRTRTLTRIKTLEDQAAGDHVNAADVQALIVSIKYLIGHMEKENIGTAQQRRTLEGIRQELLGQTAGSRLPPRGWRPDQEDPPPTSKIDAAPLREVLGRLRAAVEELG